MTSTTSCQHNKVINGYTYPCEKRKGHKGYHKSGFHAWDDSE